jgi:hypothetical protein
MKFYTDPDFFFNLWRKEMMKDNDGENKRRRKSKSGKHDQQKLANADLQQTPLSKPRNEPSYVQSHPILVNQDYYGGLQPDSQSSRQTQQYYNNMLTNAVNQGANMYGTIFDIDMTSQFNIHPVPLGSHTNTPDRNTPSRGRMPRETLSPNERPVMPPPPPPPLQSPKNKFEHSASAHGAFDFQDLPPPPSPPSETTDSSQKFQHALSISSSPSPLSLSNSNSQAESSELPLPPPPSEFILPEVLQEKQQPAFNSNTKNQTVPAPPPLDPILSVKPVNDIHQARNSVLDDIRRGFEI